MASVPSQPGKLYLGDNLDILRQGRIAPESVDLIYLDPPFNSNRDYNMLFAEHDLSASKAQLRAFEDAWRWDSVAQETFETLTVPSLASERGIPAKVTAIVDAFCRTFPRSDLAAYLVMMTARLIELRRVLKPNGSLYLHCDPTASHYLKVVLDAVFGGQLFQNEIIWQRTLSKGLVTSRLPTNHDVILLYTRGEKFTWNSEAVFAPYNLDALDPKTVAKYSLRDPDGRLYQLTSLINPSPDRPNLTYEFLGVTRVWRWEKERMLAAHKAGQVVQNRPGGVPRFKRYLDEQRGKPLGDVWTDIPPLNSQAAERIGYPTQKPIALLERIIRASSNEGDTVLDPFCGCGTTIHAAQRLNRRWIGIDITFLAIQTIEKRLGEAFPSMKFEFDGFPQDAEGAVALAERSKHQFQDWAVSVLGAEQGRAGADQGIDGRIRFDVSPGAVETALVQVKGGRHVGPTAVRDLSGTLLREGAKIGILFTAYPPTAEMKKDAAAQGTVTFTNWNTRYQRIQIISADEWFKGKRAEFPGRALTRPATEPVGSRLGENLVLPGIEAPRPPRRKATVVQLSETFRDELAAEPKRPVRAPQASRPKRVKAKAED